MIMTAWQHPRAAALRAVCACLLGIVLLGPAPLLAAKAERVALIIGNSSYPDFPLDNPINDARAISGSLAKLGFKVTRLENASLNEMFDAVSQFGENLHQEGSVGLFYYAGHGVQVDGRNYLLPVDAQIKAEDEVRYKTLDAGIVLDKMQSAQNPLNIVILDACRDNPFKQRSRSVKVSGLAQMDAPVGSLIAFATAPGAPASDGMGKNSVYTESLLRHIDTPGMTIEEVFKRVRSEVRIATEGMQIPWESTSLERNFYFAGQAEKTGAAPAEPDPEVADQRAWDAVLVVDSASGYLAYLERYPNGIHVAEARQKLSEAQEYDRKATRGQSSAQPPSAAPVEAPTLALSSSMRGRSGPTEGFSFSAAEAEDERERNASKNELEQQLAYSCALSSPRPYSIDIGEYFNARAPGGGKALEGAFGSALSQRLARAGFKVASAGTGPRIAGSVTAESTRSRMMNLNEVSLTTALSLYDKDQRTATVVGRSETFSGADDTEALVELINKEADLAAAKIISTFCAQ